MFLAGLFYGIAPTVWLDVLGPDNISKDLATVLGPVYTPLLGEFAQAGVAWFLIFNMLIGLFAPLGGPPRTIAQLAKDGLLPLFLASMSRMGVPWIAIVITSFVAILIVWVGAPTWLIAATNFQYLLCIALASVAVWGLRHSKPTAPRLYRAPDVCIYLGLFSAFIWIVATILGFRQYGLSTMLIGISFSFIGVPLYFWRKISDRIHEGLPLTTTSLHLKLTSVLIMVLILDAIGYLVAINNISYTNNEFITILEDIFVLVALLTLTVGFVVPGMVVNAAEEVNNAAKRIIKINLTSLSSAMESLGSGNLNRVEMNTEIIPISITSRDEMGEMAKSFNLMQEKIKKTALSLDNVRERLSKAIGELTNLNATLEYRVKDRTEKLELSNHQLKNEISERIKAESNLKILHDELVVAARRAGMADIANSTLHNVGNVLNSINTSTAMMSTMVLQSKLDNLSKLADLLNKHQSNLAEYLTNDPHGKLIPRFLSMLSESWQDDRKKMIEEINALKKSVEHVTSIISMQQSMNKSLSMVERISIEELINDALAINKQIYESADIYIHFQFDSISEVIIDRLKLLQVIVNLIKNSIESLQEMISDNKVITIFIKKHNEDFFQLGVKDNGIGISAEHLKKIFSSGFTTKKQGNGFGLHSAALAAKEMGGNLNVESDGIGKGACFILILPYQNISNVIVIP
jgi:signal transduction histidine kinase